MKTNIDCLPCIFNQSIKVSKFLKLEYSQREKILREVMGYLCTGNYQVSPPSIVKDIYRIIAEHSGNPNPTII